MTRIYNFSAGPATLPQSVLEQVQAELLDYQGHGMSIMEMSHRSKTYEALNAEAEERFKRLVGVGDGYRVLFMQGGASTQFALIPMNFLPEGRMADYILTGNWSKKALAEANQLGETHVAASSEDKEFRLIPPREEIRLSDDPAYVHITSNNTIYGTQWQEWPNVGDRRLVADMSSDILCRPFPAERFSLVYAGAQKNLGPAGVTLVLVREDWVEESPETLPTMFQYRTFIKKNSLHNTPPVFTIYVVNLVMKWIEENGGLEGIQRRNEEKARLIYGAIDRSSGFYRGYAAPDSRSLMNVTFQLPDAELDRRFIEEAAREGMVTLKGYRSLGGIRASIYNSMPVEGCKALASFMDEFRRKNG